jgi:hypothetical protein
MPKEDPVRTSDETFIDATDELHAAYQALPQMIAYEGQKQWSATSVFIQFSVAMIAASLAPVLVPGLGPKVQALVSALISGVGFFASIIWLAFILRYEKIIYYWVLSQRELEEQMSDRVLPFRRGRDFAKGDAVNVSGEQVGYRGLERLPERWGLRLVYVVFGAIFLSLFIFNLLRSCGWVTISP